MQPNHHRRSLLDMFRVRDRVPPPPRVTARLEGRMHWQLVGRDGKAKQEGEQSNLILDSGLDQIAVHQILGARSSSPGLRATPLIDYAVVGTDSTTPAVGQTGLLSELARTNTSWQNGTLVSPSNGVYEITVYKEFGYPDGNGNLTEWGMSFDSVAGGNLFNRELFRDGSSNPEVVVKTSDDKLRLNYTLTVTLTPIVMTAASFALTNLGTINGDYVLTRDGISVSWDTYGAAADLRLFTIYATGYKHLAANGVARKDAGTLCQHTADLSGHTYLADSGITGIHADPDTAPPSWVTDPAAYVAGSYARTNGSVRYDTDIANILFKSFGIIGTREGDGTTVEMGYVFDLDLADEFTKDNLHTLTIGLPNTSWSR